MQSNDKWIDDLGAYYRHNKEVPAIRIEMMLDTFGHHKPATLERAARLYMSEKEHFPTVGSFRPYVKTAGYQETAQAIRRVHRYSDDDIYEWELARGSMRPLVDIEAEIDESRAGLGALKLARKNRR